MATKSRFPNLGKAQKVASQRDRNDNFTSQDGASMKQVTLSRFFKLPSKQVPSGSKYDVEDHKKGSVKTQTRKRSGSPRSCDSASKEDNPSKKVKRSPSPQRGETHTPPKVTKTPPKLATSTMSALSQFSAAVTPDDLRVRETCTEQTDNLPQIKSSQLEETTKPHPKVTKGSKVSSKRPQNNKTGSKSCHKSPVSRDGWKNGKVKTTELKGHEKTKLTDVKEIPTLTPLEKQVMAIKEQHPDVILFVECGYRFRFFDKDAEIAAKELNICAYPDHNFFVASIPTHRLFVHAHRLVAKGYKVGVVRQTETAAIKAAGSNRSAPFERKLTALYTKSTMIGEDLQSAGTEDVYDDKASDKDNFLLCVCEFDKPKGKEKVIKPSHTATTEIGIVAVQPSTGDIIYDCFHDNSTRQELETRIHHIKPVEMLLPKEISENTEKLLKGIICDRVNNQDTIRIERFGNDCFEKTRAFEEVTSFFSDCPSGQGSTGDNGLQHVLRLPVPVICCLAALIGYLSEFKLHGILRQTRSLRTFSSTEKYMKLNSCVISNLEIFKNQSNGKTRGTLLWAIDHTRTSFGSRQLSRWISQPLLDVSKIKQRQDAIQELMETNFQALISLKDFLSKAPDLEKSLCSIYHKKCSPADFVTIIQNLKTLHQLCSSHAEYAQKEVRSKLLLEVFHKIPRLLQDVDKYSQALNQDAAREGDKTRLFVKPEDFPMVEKCMQEIEKLNAIMMEHRRKVRLQLRMPSLTFATVSGYEYLVEIKNVSTSLVPNTWKRISSTKQVSRFRPPFVEETFKELCRTREKLVIACQEAWLQFLEAFGEKFFTYRRAIKFLAGLDCLFSLSEVAKQDGFCRPEILDTATAAIHIKNGRHPVVSSLLGEGEQYMPNSTHLEGDKERFMSVSGPNMGGKSSYLKQVALIVLLAQIGSHVPAEEASITPMDAIYVRMGASDNIFKHKSTFMVELLEASTILNEATQRSLVILDELGRGTSTHDGVAIAYAAAKYLITEVKCITLFVTHYPPLAELEQQYEGTVGNYHMAFLLHQDNEKENENNQPVLTFLYQLVRGAASRSYGLNVARLADLPEGILQMAAKKSQELEHVVLTKRKRKEDFANLWNADKKSLGKVTAILSDRTESENNS
ncbi:DNA mismatch repair protein Msh3 [Holothuria leucospilota]|uniref:DNA mismatch repair protein n=1 Tax=Holothuria leucospilota TaxID=206669 RepID=A0A9Q1H1H6_HOLLE|nr:DNA mismatch repair protein Msh3 [Holothuria leucospilota]